MRFFNFFHREPKPYDTGYLSECDGHQIYYQQFGNPNGKVILSFHGGPGGSGRAKHTRAYDLKKYRFIVFDQRGGGKSLARDTLYKNTTPDLLKDAMRLLDTLKIKGKIVVSGGSWGATLALLFAEQNPARVGRIDVNSVFLAHKRDCEWMPKGSRLFYPDLLEKFETEACGKNIIPYFTHLILSKKKADNERALRSYASYERVLGRTNPRLPEGPFTEADMTYPRIFFHYDSHKYFVRDNQILKDAPKIAHIPTYIFHNRLDMSCPVLNAWELHKALPKSKLYIIPNRGHGSPLMFKIKKQVMKDI